MLRLVIVMFCIFLIPTISSADIIRTIEQKSTRRPNHVKPYAFDTYEYYLYLGELQPLLSSQVFDIVQMVDESFRDWGVPTVPVFLGVTDTPQEIDGINTIGFEILVNYPNAKGITTYSSYGNYVVEADIVFTIFNSWKELGIVVSLGGDDMEECSFKTVLRHEVGHALGMSSHEKKYGTLMHGVGACDGVDKYPSKNTLKKMEKSYAWRHKMMRKGKLRIVALGCTE